MQQLTHNVSMYYSLKFIFELSYNKITWNLVSLFSVSSLNLASELSSWTDESQECARASAALNLWLGFLFNNFFRKQTA